jgi:2-iminobutanoate/2-iminopropanoate deaminase
MRRPAHLYRHRTMEYQLMKTQAGPLLLVLLALTLALPLAQGAAERAAQRSYVAYARAGAGAPPGSAGVRSGNTLYLAGHLGLDPVTGCAPADGAAEARLLMDAVQRTVTDAGLRMDDLVSITVFSTDVSRNESFDAIYRTYFHGHYPARGFVGTSTLQHGAHFEILGVAVKPPHMQL